MPREPRLSSLPHPHWPPLPLLPRLTRRVGPTIEPCGPRTLTIPPQPAIGTAGPHGSHEGTNSFFHAETDARPRYSGIPSLRDQQRRRRSTTPKRAMNSRDKEVYLSNVDRADSIARFISKHFAYLVICVEIWGSKGYARCHFDSHISTKVE
jgi:hypothetical protein